MSELEKFSQLMLGDAILLGRKLVLSMGGYRLGLRSNSEDLLEQLAVYFSHVVSDTTQDCHAEIIAIESAELELPVTFIDWKREPGKTGRKDSYVDFEGGRLVRKVRTGMLFLQSPEQLIAAGPCLDNDNQVINYINSQYMNWLQNHGWLICHASGIVRDDRCLAIAGFSGGGKSTLMLQMLEHPEYNYLTNDRLFIKSADTSVEAVGIPKLPRINPGTIVHNPRLHPLMDVSMRQQYLDMPPEELWHIEEKYDAHIDRLYGDNRIQAQAQLGGVLILNWQRDAQQQTSLQKIDLQNRQELLAAVMKSPGPFYQRNNGSFLNDDEPLDEAPYLQVLKDIPIYEMSGRIDFSAAITLLGEKVWS